MPPGLSPFRRERARRLRGDRTEAERRLWRALRRVPVSGSHFRQQVPIGSYVADFACLAARLVIELDGGHHARDEIAAGDLVRQRWLEAQGYRVLRFWNAEIASNLDGVLETIYAALHGQVAAEPRHLAHRRRRRDDTA
jgi:very-short-patch-repair endonuclease